MTERESRPRDVILPLAGLRVVTKKYSGTAALSGVSCDFDIGVTVLLGRNGAGKSTLCRVLAGVEAPDSGEVLRDGKPLLERADLREHLRRTGWLPQSFAAHRAMTVAQFVTYAGWLKDLEGRELSGLVDQALDAVELTELRDRRLGDLSGGMLRRLGIAQATIHRPNLLVLDEPTVGLDPEQRAGFHELIRKLGQDRSVVLSTHLLEDVAAMALRVTILDQGVALFSGTRSELIGFGSGADDTERLRSGFLRVVSRPLG